MTLHSRQQKLNKNQIQSIENAVKDAGIQQIHPEKMEAFAEHFVQKIKEKSSDKQIEDFLYSYA